MPPASLLDQRARQRARLYGAVDNVWNRDDGAHRPAIRALLAALDAGRMSLADVTNRMREMDRSTHQRRAA